MKKTTEPGYAAWWEELQQILQEIQSENMDIDSLGEKVRRANALILLCRERLRKTEAELEQLNKKT